MISANEKGWKWSQETHQREEKLITILIYEKRNFLLVNIISLYKFSVKYKWIKVIASHN